MFRAAVVGCSPVNLNKLDENITINGMLRERLQRKARIVGGAKWKHITGLVAKSAARSLRRDTPKI